MADLNNEPCPRLGKWIGGCRFEARYDTPVDDRYGLRGMWQSHELKISPDGKTCTVKEPPPPMKTYVRDVCVTCGRTIDRSLPYQREEA